MCRSRRPRLGTVDSLHSLEHYTHDALLRLQYHYTLVHPAMREGYRGEPIRESDRLRAACRYT